jgi:hypothetical protein
MTDIPVTIPSLPSPSAAKTAVEIEHEIAERIAEICAEYHLPEALAPCAAEVLVRNTATPIDTSNLPRFAPELYVKRPTMGSGGRRENIIEFLCRVWGPWMNSGRLSRADLRKLDQHADKAVENWLQRHRQLPRDINLPACPKRPCQHPAPIVKVACPEAA